MRNQLLRSPSKFWGSVFTASQFTAPANKLAHFLAAQTTLLWTRNDIDYCFENLYFLGSLEAKLQYALREGKPDYDLAFNKPKNGWSEV